MSIKLAEATCSKCGSQGPVIGKREKALCPKCYQNKIRQPKPGSVPKPRQPIKIKKEYKIPKKSKQQLIIDAEYAKLRGPFLKENPNCKINIEGCLGVAGEVHHTRGRGKKYMLDVSTWLPACRVCHNWELSHSQQAKELGIIKSRLGKDFIR